jgi:hypothetical protein
MAARAVIATAVVALALTAVSAVGRAAISVVANGPGPAGSSAANVPRQQGGDKEEQLYPAMGSGHSVKAVRDEGRFVTLEDNSLWEIEPTGRHLTAKWEVQAGIAVRHSGGDDGFVYEIDNIDTDDGASARWVRPAPRR